MTAADVTGWLDRLAETHKAASKAPYALVGGTHGREVIDDHGCHVATTGTFPDAAAIVDAHNALPQLVAAVRGVLALADDLETTADSRQVLALDAEAAGASEESIFLRDRADDERAQADRIRSAVTAALDGAR